MLYFSTENERNLFSIENRPVGFYTECLLKRVFKFLRMLTRVEKNGTVEIPPKAVCFGCSRSGLALGLYACV